MKTQSYGRGIVGAILGGLVGLILWVLAVWIFGGNLNLMFGFVLAMAVYYGYLLLRGKFGKGFYVIFIISVLFFGAIALFTALVMMFLSAMGLTSIEALNQIAVKMYNGDSWTAFFDLLKQGYSIVFENIKEFTSYILTAAFFEALGIAFFVLKGSRRREVLLAEETQEIQEVEEGQKNEEEQELQLGQQEEEQQEDAEL